MTGILTLVGAKQAKKGAKFIHIGHAEACENCELYKVCIGNLEPKRVYEITDIRDVQHPCKIHEGGVRVVEVVYSSVKVALEAKQAIPGATITYSPIDCTFHDCPLIELCKPDCLFEGDKCIVEGLVEKVEECRAGKNLMVVSLRFLGQSSFQMLL
ncbi:MAG: UPF0179 family protein [Candidatus Jordarchaeaceae archaeon]